MGVAVLLIVIALAVGGLGLLVEGLMWLLLIAGALFLIGAFTGWTGRRDRGVTA
jgi:hypothetical protein